MGWCRRCFDYYITYTLAAAAAAAASAYSFTTLNRLVNVGHAGFFLFFFSLSVSLSFAFERKKTSIKEKKKKKTTTIPPPLHRASKLFGCFFLLLFSYYYNNVIWERTFHFSGDLIRSTHTQFTYSFFHIYTFVFLWFLLTNLLVSSTILHFSPHSTQGPDDWEFLSCLFSWFLYFFSTFPFFSFLEAIISSFIWQWNGNYALPTAVTYTVAFIDSSFVWQFPFFHSLIVSFRFCFYYFYSWLFVLAY